MKTYPVVAACLAAVVAFVPASFAAAAAAPVEVSALDQIPSRIQATVPVYPPALAKSHAKDDVSLVLVIDATGKVIAVEDVKASQPAFAEAARAAVKQWLFNPGFVEGKPVSFRLPVTLAFRPGEARDTDAAAKVVGGNGLAQFDTPAVDFQVSPAYPESLRAKPVNGDVIVDLLVDATGTPSDPVVEMTSHPAFAAPAREAVLKWKFTAGKKAGVATPMRTHLHVRFLAKEAEFTDAERHIKDQLAHTRDYDVAPKEIKTTLVYPFDALLAGDHGSATLMVRVTPTGDVLQTAVESATTPEYAAAARASVASWKFTPATKSGIPVFADVSILVPFAENENWLRYDDVTHELIEGLRAKTLTFPSPRALDAPLHPVEQVRPVLSPDMAGDASALEANIEFIIDRNGRCQLPHVISASTTEFGFAAATAAAQWKFDPPRKGGQPVDVRVRVPFKLMLKSDEKSAADAPAASP